MSIRQRVLTFYGERWYESRYHDDHGMYEYIVHGYRVLDETVNALIEHDNVNAHSVNHSHIFIPQGDELLIEFFVTVLYTGPSPREIYGSTNGEFKGTITDKTTLLEVKHFSQVYKPKGA